jgi:hypothetical protein
MQTSNAEQGSRSINIVWYLLGEYSLSNFILDPEKGDAITTGLLSQMVQGMGIPDQYVEHIERTLSSFARKVLAHFKQDWVELPGRIRIFCQQKMVDEEMHGGWGYFVIERSRDPSTCDAPATPHFIDLYLYKEGE